MKKRLAFLLALALMLTALTACGGKTETGTSPADSSNGSQTQASGDSSNYPSKTVTIICPWGVGGGADTIARKITQVAEKYFDQPIIVENHTGASGTIGMGDSYAAEPDGYTLAITNGPLFSLTPKYVEVEYSLDDFTQNKAIQKCRESNRISREEKEMLNGLKRGKSHELYQKSRAGGSS